MAVCGTETVEAAFELPEPSPEGAASLLDLTLEALLPGILPPGARSFVPILGALSSVSQLHCGMENRQPVCLDIVTATAITLKNSPKQELYGLQGFPFAYLRSLVNQKRRTSSMRSRGSSEVPIATKALGASR